MKISFKTIGWPALLILMVVTGSVMGAITIYTPETWNTPGDLNGWTYAVGTPPNGGASSVNVVDPIGGHSAVRIAFAAQGFAAPEDEKVYAVEGSSSDRFAGNENYALRNDYGIRFNFYADDYTTPSDTLSAFFYSGTSGRTWQYAFNGPATIDTWYNYVAPMSYNANWFSVGAGEAEFNTDLADVDQLGIWVMRSSDLGAQSYGLDDFEVFVPEPETWAILAFTLLTLGITLRRKHNAVSALQIPDLS
jgi:hypothetical protein